MLNVFLIIVVLLLAIFIIFRFIRKKQAEQVEEQIQVDDKTYTLELMKEFVKKRLDEITKINL